MTKLQIHHCDWECVFIRLFQRGKIFRLELTDWIPSLGVKRLPWIPKHCCHIAIYFRKVDEGLFFNLITQFFPCCFAVYICVELTHIESMFPFGTPWKHQRTFRASGVFRGVPKGKIDSIWVKAIKWKIGHFLVKCFFYKIQQVPLVASISCRWKLEKVCGRGFALLDILLLLYFCSFFMYLS